VNVLLPTTEQYGRSPLRERLCYTGTHLSECLNAHTTAIWALNNVNVCVL